MATVPGVTAAGVSTILTNGVTAGVSVGVALGIVSGLFYLTCAGIRWAGRLRGAAEEDEEEEAEADRKALALARERRLNARACVRCRRGFPRSGPILHCARCRFRICGDCCVPGDIAAPGTCLCISCYREVQLKSGDWFYSQLRKRFGGFGVQPEEGSFLHRNCNKALAEEVDSETAKVREFVERLVEALVSGGLDNVNINRLYSHPEYDCMFNKYHSSLCDAIARLTIALQMSISHQPLPINLDRIGKREKDGLVAMVGEEDDDGLLCSPSVAHAQLKTLVQQVIDEARELPRLGIQQFASNGFNRQQSDEGDIEMENSTLGNNVQSEHEDFASKTYEDILATAILNKVILQCQKENEWGHQKEAGGVDRNRNLLVDRVEVGVQAEVETFRTRGDGCGPEGASAEEYAEEDDEDDNDNSNFNSFGRWRNRSQPISYTIEKKVEEVMTTYSSEEEENVGDPRHEDDLLAIERDRTLSSSSSFDEDTSISMMRGLAMHRKSAPFPEFGVDIIDIDDDGDNEFCGGEAGHAEDVPKINSTTVISGVDSWEENWLFQRRQLKMRGALSNGGYCSVPMLVPNPSEDLHAQIGDVDAEEISDLSECNDSTEWDVNDDFTRSHHLSSSSASVISDSLSSEALSDPLPSSVPGNTEEFPVEAKNHGLLDFAEAQNHQQDSEYTEDYAAAEQRRLALTPSPIPQERENDLETSHPSIIGQKPVPRPRTQIPPVSRVTLSPQKYVPPGNRQLPPISKMKLLQAPESAVIHAGKVAHFILGLWSHLPSDVWWFQEELLLEEDDNHRIFSTIMESDRSCMEYHLEIFNTDPQNSSGNYSVVAVDACGNSIWQDFTLTVKGSRRTDFSPEFVVEPNDVTVAEGEEVEFLIEVKGYPEPKVSFWKGASLLHTSPNGYVIERQGGGHWTFRINKIAPIDGGKFVIEARNRLGVAMATAEVQVVKLETPSPLEESMPNVEKEMRALSTLEESSSVLQNGLKHQAEELRTSANKLSQLISQLEDLEIHIHSMEAEFGSLHSDLELGGVDMTTYMSSPWSTPLSSVSSSPPSSLSTSSSQAISALEDSSLEQRKAHLQQLLTCLQKEVEEAEGSRDELSECSPKKDIHSTEEEAAPPRPGTIAEREHRKWASAPPMPDNPYSPERISERLRSINLKKSLEASRGSCSDASIDFPEFQSESESSEVVVPKVTINCGGKYLNPKKYSRDYYINNDSDSGRHVVHRNKDRDDERKQPNKGEQIDTIKENEDLDRRKKGLLLVEAEISQPQEFIRKNEKGVMQGIEVAKCLTHLFSDSEQKFSDPESDDVIHQAIEKSPPKKDMCTINNTSTLDMKALNNEVLPTSAMLPLGGFMNGSHSSVCVEQDEKVPVDNVKHIAEASSNNFKVDLIMPESCGTSSPEPKSLPIQMPEKFPSLPSVRRLARHFSGASKGEKNEKTPISKKKKKVSKEVIIVKKTAGSEARTDPPLQVETNYKLKHAAFASSFHKACAWNNSGFGPTNCSSLSLPLHNYSNALPMDLHDTPSDNSEIIFTQENIVPADKKSAHQPAVCTNNKNVHLNRLMLGSASSIFLSHGTMVPENNRSLAFESKDGLFPEKCASDNQESPGFDFIGMHSSPLAKFEDSVEKHVKYNLNNQDHQKLQLRMAQNCTKCDSQLPLACTTECASPHQNFSPQVSPILCCCVISPETMELPLDTGGRPPRQRQQKATEGDKHLPNPSEYIPMKKIVSIDDRTGGHQDSNVPPYQDASDCLLSLNKYLQCDKQIGDKNTFLVQQSKAEYFEEQPINHHYKAQENEVHSLQAVVPNFYTSPKKLILKDNESHKRNNLSGMVEEDSNGQKSEGNTSVNEQNGSLEVGTQEEEKHSINWDGVRLSIRARFGARTASGKSSFDEENSGRRKKKYLVHSLTARSISREFREGLRQSQQIPLGKPVANPSEKLENHKRSSDEQMQQPESVDQIEVEPRPFPRKCLSKDDPVLDSHCEALLVNYPKTSNGTNSHEGTTTGDSITPEMDGLFLRNVEGSIAFWERLSPQCGSSSNNQKDV